MESESSKKQDETQEQQQQQQQQQQEVVGREGAFCKYNEETERCVYNPDANAVANDEECYKTEKNRCALKKKKMMKIKIKPKRVEEAVAAATLEEAVAATVEEEFCKYNKETERCVYNPDANASANDEECYKTEKNRCASKKKKMRKIKINPKKAIEIQQEEELVDEVQSPAAAAVAAEAFCKYNEATERCVYNPDLNATANDEECYKTEKNRCASKKKKMRKIKINPKKATEVQVEEEKLVDKVQSPAAAAVATEAFCKYNEATERCVYNQYQNHISK